ncbi:MAG: hypothetical protein JSR80_03950 [Verrucomicrobia bacterium]|nr:hypothetical protein [Verrucomicrobiota bacterium]
MAKKDAGKAPSNMTDTFQEVLKLLRNAPQTPPAGEHVNIDEVIERLEGALEKLNQQMEDVYQRTGMSKEQLEEYASNPKNFSEEEWSMLGQIKGELGKYRERAEQALLEVAPLGEEEGKKGTLSPKRRRRKSWLQS